MRTYKIILLAYLAYSVLSTLIPPISYFAITSSYAGCCFLGTAIIGGLVATRGVVWSLLLPALIQSDSDSHIKMQILACALLAILSLPFSLCGMLRGTELDHWPWGWIFKWPPDFPTEQHQPGFHLHTSFSPFTAYHRCRTHPQLSSGATIHRTFKLWLCDE